MSGSARRLGPITFSLVGSPLSESERQLIEALARRASDAGEPEWTIEVLERASATHVDPQPGQQLTEATAREVEGGNIALDHSSFSASVRLDRRTLILERPVEVGSYPLAISLRTLAAIAIALKGGIALHSLGVVMRGRGTLFVGPSGIGKSTLARRSPFPVLSDEMVAVIPTEQGYVVSASGIWGSFPPRLRQPPNGDFVLEQIVLPRKGDLFAFEPVSPSHAAQSLMRCALVPPARRLWASTLIVIGRICEVIPINEMTWSLSSDPYFFLAPK